MFGTAFLFRSRRSSVIAAIIVAALAGSAGMAAAQTTPQAVPGAGEPAAGATPAPPAGIAPPSATSPSPASPQAGAPQTTGAPDEDQSASDAQPVDLPAQPVAILSGKSDWDNGFQTLQDDFAKIRAEMAKAGLTAAGRPFAVFLQTDDQSFTFNAMIPVTGAQGQTALANGVTLGASPAGKTIKFQHEGAYDDIDATYEAINAYLDEKGLEAQDLFIEQYLNDAKGSDDPDLNVDIYVFLKP